MDKDDAAVVVEDGVHPEIDETLGSVGHVIGKDFAVVLTTGGIRDRFANLLLGFLRVAPPERVPKRLA